MKPQQLPPVPTFSKKGKPMPKVTVTELESENDEEMKENPMNLISDLEGGSDSDFFDKVSELNVTNADDKSILSSRFSTTSKNNTQVLSSAASRNPKQRLVY